MAFNVLSGTVVMPGVFQVPEGGILSGNLSTSDAGNVKNVPRVSNATNNALITNVSGDANTLTCESNLLFDGSTLSLVGTLTGSGAASFQSLAINGGRASISSAGALVVREITASAGFKGTTISGSGAGSFGTLNINNGVATIGIDGATTLGTLSSTAITATTVSGTYGYFKNDVTSSAAGKFATLDINNGAGTISAAGALDIGAITATTVSGTYGYFKNDVTSSGAGKFTTLEINNGSAAISAAGSLRLSSSAYLNWGNTIGASGYGLRDNSGTIQFKTHTGSWADLGSGGSGGGGSGNANGQGVTGSIQYHTSGGTITGSARLRFIGDSMVMTGSLFMTGNLEVDGALLPVTGNTHDLGSAAKPWGTLYVSSSSIYFGTEKVSVENNNLRFGSGSATKGFQVGFMRFRNRGITMAPDKLFELKAFQMSFAGGIAYKRNVVATDYQILKTDYIVSVQTDTVTASVTLTLPNADDCTNGQTFVIKDEGGAANTRPIQIDCSGSDVIDGQNQVILESPYAAIQIYCNGSNKYFIC